MKLILIPEDKYSDYRYEAIFKAYKWDPQVSDHNTIAKHAVLMETSEIKQLEEWAEKLSKETILMEEALAKKPELAKDLKLPRKVKNVLSLLNGYKREQNVRLMRFDFHPTDEGWKVSEVNSDVPGGFAEASVLQELACEYFDEYMPCKNPALSLLRAIKSKIKENGTVAFVHATSYSDDRQIMQYLSDCFKKDGLNTIFAAPDHIKWNGKKAYCVLKDNQGEIDAIVRYFPLEWLVALTKKSNWTGFYDSQTLSCNPAISIFAQSKRLPLIWDKIGIDILTWKMLLPPTLDPRAVKRQSGWIFKPALGRVGVGISIKEALSPKELKRIEKDVRLHPNDWVAQKMFKSEPLTDHNGEAYHFCLGVFTIDGKAAGLYGRVSKYPRIDTNAIDIPILIPKEGTTYER